MPEREKGRTAARGRFFEADRRGGSRRFFAFAGGLKRGGVVFFLLGRGKGGKSGVIFFAGGGEA